MKANRPKFSYFVINYDGVNDADSVHIASQMYPNRNEAQKAVDGLHRFEPFANFNIEEVICDG